MAQNVRCGEDHNHTPHNWGIRNNLYCDGEINRGFYCGPTCKACNPLIKDEPRPLAEVLEEYMEGLRRERCTCGAVASGSKFHSKACPAGVWRTGIAQP